MYRKAYEDKERTIREVVLQDMITHMHSKSSLQCFPDRFLLFCAHTSAASQKHKTPLSKESFAKEMRWLPQSLQALQLFQIWG